MEFRMTNFIEFYSDRGGVAAPEILLPRPHGSRKISGLQVSFNPYRSSTEDNFDLGARL
jgi:hypothetical protein